MSKRYISENNLPPRIPIIPALWTATALKVFEAPEWLWGVFGVLYLILLIAALVKIFTYEKVEL